MNAKLVTNSKIRKVTVVRKRRVRCRRACNSSSSRLTIPGQLNSPQQILCLCKRHLCGVTRSCYQEIGAEMGGNALTIRVHKDRNKIEEYDGDDDDCGCYCLPGGGKLKKKSNYTAPAGQGKVHQLQLLVRDSMGHKVFYYYYHGRFSFTTVPWISWWRLVPIILGKVWLHTKALL